MKLPEGLQELIDDFVSSFSKLDYGKRWEAKRNLSRTIVALYPDCIDFIIENIKIPQFNDFKGQCKNHIENFRKATTTAIEKYNLYEYRDIIMENYTLSIPKLLKIAEYCFDKTSDIDKVCEVYCVLGYCHFDNRNSNEDYLISFMSNWIKFSTKKGISVEKAQLMLLMEFYKIDTQDDFPIFDHKNKWGIWSFFPFTLGNVEKLVDFIIKFDNFDSEDFKVKVGLIEAKEGENPNSFFWNDEGPKCSLLCNFYVYIFNKLNDSPPYSAFAVCVFVKWLRENQSVISKYLAELSSSEIESLLIDYALDKYSDITSIPNGFEAELCEWLKTHQDEKVIELLYKLYYHTTISDYELVDLWVYIVINRSLSYRKFQTNETSPILQVVESDYVEDGEIMLPWKYVRFVDGKAFFYHPCHERGNEGKLPYKLEFDKVQKNFMELSKTILWNFPFIKCSVEGGKIINIDISFAKYVISELAYINKILSRRPSFNYNSSSMAQEILLRYKSQQFDHLKHRQIKQVEIIPIMEKISNYITQREEPSLLFTTAKNSKTSTLVYESTCIARATYIFIVDGSMYEKAVKIIKSYFMSDKVNKRTELQFSRDVFKKSDGFLRVIRVLHDDMRNWKASINFYSK